MKPGSNRFHPQEAAHSYNARFTIIPIRFHCPGPCLLSRGGLEKPLKISYITEHRIFTIDRNSGSDFKRAGPR